MKGEIGQKKRLAILTGCGPEHFYLVNRLCEQFAIEVIIVDKGRKRSIGRQLKRYGLGVAILKLLRRAYLLWVHDQDLRRQAIVRVLGSDLIGGFQRADLLKYVDGINGPESVRILKEIRPTAILVFGTALISNTVLSIAREVAINTHTGISPYYRGADCAFWPIHNKEPEMLGATVHECTRTIDGGRIFRAGHVALNRGDGLHEAFARCVMRGAELCVGVVRDYLDGQLQGRPQNLNVGREYRAYMRTLGPELRARRIVRKALGSFVGGGIDRPTQSV